MGIGAGGLATDAGINDIGSTPAPTGDAIAPTSPTDAMSPTMGPEQAPSGTGGVLGAGTPDAQAVPLAPGFTDTMDFSGGGYMGDPNVAAGGSYDSDQSGAGNTATPLSGDPVHTGAQGGVTAASTSNQVTNAQGQPVSTQGGTTPGAGKAGGNQSSQQQAAGLINQIMNAMRQSGQQMNPMQLQNMLNNMGMPNRGGLNFAQRAQLRLMAQNMRSQAAQNLWNAGVKNPRGDSRYGQMMNNIRTQVAASAQQMIQQNFQNALQQNQQLMQMAQLQMNQQNQYGNAVQGLMQRLMQTGAASSGGGGATSTFGGAGTGAGGVASS